MSKSDLEIAREVMAGKWGTGKQREIAITKAGYDYNTIQGYVNRMIKTGLPIKEIEIDANKCCGLVVNIKVNGDNYGI